MITIASLLNDSASKNTQTLWKCLEEQCDLTKILGAPIPHLSWLTMDDCDLEGVSSVLESVSKEVSPFNFYTAGLGLFTGSKPVLYLAAIKNQKMVEIHQSIWLRTERYCQSRNHYYAPDSWIPHITLAYEDLSGENIACAIRDLINRPLNFEFMIDNMAVLFKKEKEYGVLSKVTLSSAI